MSLDLTQHIELNHLHRPPTGNLQSIQPDESETHRSNRSSASSPTQPQPHQQQDDTNTTPPSLHATFAPSPRTSAISNSPSIGTASTLVPTIPIFPATRPRRNPTPRTNRPKPWNYLLIIKPLPLGLAVLPPSPPVRKYEQRLRGRGFQRCWDELGVCERAGV